MLGDMQGIRKNFDYALSLDEDDKINILLSIAAILHNLNYYQLLMPYLEKLIDLEPNYFTHLYDLAFAYEKIGDYEKSILSYNKYLDKDPFSDNAWYNLGLLFNKTNKPEKAIEAYEYALVLNPDNYFALFNKGNILSNIGNFKEALSAYLEYLENENDSSEAMTYAAECYDRLGQNELALKYYQEAIELDPEFSEPWFGIGMMSLTNDDVNDESIHFFERAVTLDAENPEYWYYLGKAQYRLMKTKDALRSFREALKIDPFYDSVWTDIGHLIISERLYSKVTFHLEKVLKVIGDVHGLRFVLAASYLYNGRLDRCYDHLSVALPSTGVVFEKFSDLFPGNMLNNKLKSLIENNTRKEDEK
jgi:tetratricopeptide (TPR) repeat protein